MAITTSASGTKTSGSLDTVYTLATDTVGVFVAMWNLELNVKSDITRVFVTTKVLTGDTEATVFEGVYAKNDLLANCIIQSPPIVSMFAISMKMEQTDGTWRDVPWSLIKIAS